MQNKDIDIISLNMNNLLLKDQKGEIIYPGDLLIKNNEFLEFAENKFNNSSIENFILKDGYESIIPFIKSLPYPTSLYSLSDDISVAEYFNIDIKNIKNPILGLHGLLQSMKFNINQNFIERSPEYKHLKNDELDKYKIGIISTNEFSKNEKNVELLIKKLISKFSGKVKILKIVPIKTENCISENIIFKYKIKDMISYKKAKKIQKGIFERLNWYKKYDKIMFPWIYYFYKEKNIFEKALNDDEIIKKYNNSVQEMLNNYYQILYHYEEKEDNHTTNHKNFSIFCKKNKFSNKKIYFYKGV